MPTIRGFTAERMKQIEDTTVIGGEVVDGNLILQLRNGTLIDAGPVVGDRGPTGPAGSPVPTGTVLEYAGDVAPSGYLMCGQEVLRSAYSDLFGVIGTKYGAGNGTTTFNLPPKSGRVSVGLDAAQTEFNALGKTGGVKTVTLSTDQMPSHDHPISVGINGNHQHQSYGSDGAIFVNGGGSSMVTPQNGQAPYTSTNGAHSHDADVTNTGGGQAHNNLQPFVVMNYIIKT